MHKRKPILALPVFALLSAALQAYACSWVVAKHDWTINGPGGEYGIQEYGKPNPGTYICLGRRRIAIPMGAYCAVGIAGTAIGLCLGAWGVWHNRKLARSNVPI